MSNDKCPKHDQAPATGRKFLSHLVVMLGLAGCFGAPDTLMGQAQPPAPPADAWITNIFRYPDGSTTNVTGTNEFGTLHAEVVAKRVKVVWVNEALPGTASVTLQASADDLGHWPARDWRSYPMTRRGVNWEASPPVDSVDVPLVYYVRMSNTAGVAISPMRICRPRAAGLEEATRVFWPFLDGFEEQLEGWRLMEAEDSRATLQKGTPSKNGKAALVIGLPAGKQSVTVATTRVRGWQVYEKTATGVRIWLRTRTGAGRARFTLLANTKSSSQVIAPFPDEVTLTNQWQRINLPFASFPKLPLSDIDLLTIEFIGEGPAEFLADDLQLLGPWVSLGN